MLWELEPSSPHFLVQVRLAPSPHHRTVVSPLQDGINSSFWMAQRHLSLIGYVSEEIHLSSVIGQIYPVLLYPAFKFMNLNWITDLYLSRTLSYPYPSPFFSFLFFFQKGIFMVMCSWFLFFIWIIFFVGCLCSKCHVFFSISVVILSWHE